MSTTDLPPVQSRIKTIIDEKFNGSVRAFALSLGLTDSQKINRLFKVDSRNGKFPTPSIDILSLISNKFGISLEWLQYGDDAPAARQGVLGDHNTQVAGNGNTVGSSSSLDLALAEIAEQRKLVARSQELVAKSQELAAESQAQVSRLIGLLETQKSI